eukprot:jgi/Antlo1/2210/1340
MDTNLITQHAAMQTFVYRAFLHISAASVYLYTNNRRCGEAHAVGQSKRR